MRRLEKFRFRFGSSQQGQGFKKKFSTETACLEIQTKLSNSCDDGNYAALASLDLTSVFDVVNKKLLRKQLQVMGIPTKLIQLLDDGFVVGQLIVKLIKLTMKSLMLIKEPFKVFH